MIIIIIPTLPTNVNVCSDILPLLARSFFFYYNVITKKTVTIKRTSIILLFFSHVKKVRRYKGGNIVSTLQRIALFLVIIGAINWGLIGFFNYDLVASLFGGQASFVSRVIYAIVGISGLIVISLLFKPQEEFVESPQP